MTEGGEVPSGPEWSRRPAQEWAATAKNVVEFGSRFIRGLKEASPARRHYTPKEQELATGEKESERRLEGGVNEVYEVTLKSGSKGIFKPKDGERPGLREKIPAGSYYRRERAAYLVDYFLKFGLIPPTVIRKFDDRLGNFQEFIPDAKHPPILSKYYDKSEAGVEQLYRLWILDYILWSSDRHESNLLVDRNGLHAIDNGLAFARDIRSSYGEFPETPAPAAVVESLKSFMADTSYQSNLAKVLRELLPGNEASACMERIKRVNELLTSKGKIDSLDFLYYDSKSYKKYGRGKNPKIK